MGIGHSLVSRALRPEAVATYADRLDIESLSPIFNSLIKGYNEDVERYAKNEEQVRIIRHILDTAWLSAGWHRSYEYYSTAFSARTNIFG